LRGLLDGVSSSTVEVLISSLIAMTALDKLLVDPFGNIADYDEGVQPDSSIDMEVGTTNVIIR
jgi:hypothetical protein